MGGGARRQGVPQIFFAGRGSLTNAPRGYAKDHPLVEDLKRKDFIGLAVLSKTDVTSADFRALVVERFKQAGPFMRFLCGAVELRF